MVIQSHFQDLKDYLDGTEEAIVASAARRLDYRSMLAGQMSYEIYQATMEKSDYQLLRERDGYRDMENGKESIREV